MRIDGSFARSDSSPLDDIGQPNNRSIRPGFVTIISGRTPMTILQVNIVV